MPVSPEDLHLARTASWMRLLHHRSGKNCKKRLHTAFDVVVYVTMEEPRPNVVRHHICLDHHHWLQVNHVGAHVVEDHCLPVPMWRMNVVLIAIGKQIPTDSFPLFHSH